MKNERDIRTYSTDELKVMRARREGRSDWSKVDAISDEELNRLIAEDGDEAPLPETWPEGVKAGLPTTRRERADMDAFDCILNRKGGQPPQPGDELPDEEDAAPLAKSRTLNR